MSKRLVKVGIGIGIWASVYCFLQMTLGFKLGLELELWPVLAAPGIVKLMGDNKEAQTKYCKQGITGVLLAVPFALCLEHLLPKIGPLGVFVPLAIIIALIIILGGSLPNWFGNATIIMFNFATIIHDDLIIRTLSRLGLLIFGVAIFFFIEHQILKVIVASPKEVPAKQA